MDAADQTTMELRADRLDDGRDYDVVVVGGSIAGSATALQLLRQHPGLKLLIVERLETLDRRVGESTVELSTYFLTRVLGLTKHLNEQHLVKQGFRFWFDQPENESFAQCTEMGGAYLTRVTSFQVDRETLDAHVAELTRQAGAQWARPASVRSFELHDGGLQQLTLREAGEERDVKTRWLVDATGRQGMLRRKMGWHQPTENHPTASVWARFRNVADFDGLELTERYPELRQGVFGMRHLATNHLLGDGWWAWLIPLKNGDMSVGVVWDQDRFDWPRNAGPLGEQLRHVVESHPVGKTILGDAELIDADVHTLRNLPYTSSTYAGDGFALVGDAGAFVDPFYSMGLDSLAMSSTSAVHLISTQLTDPDSAKTLAEVDRHNATFRISYPRWFEAIYKNKYAYMGDYELMYIAFTLEVGLYYLGVVQPPYKRGAGTLLDGMFYAMGGRPVYLFMRHINRRLASIGEARQRRGTWGRKNLGRRKLVPGFTFGPGMPTTLTKALLAYLKLELCEGWRRGKRQRVSKLQPGSSKGLASGV